MSSFLNNYETGAKYMLFGSQAQNPERHRFCSVLTAFSAFSKVPALFSLIPQALLVPEEDSGTIRKFTHKATGFMTNLLLATFAPVQVYAIAELSKSLKKEASENTQGKDATQVTSSHNTQDEEYHTPRSKKYACILAVMIWASAAAAIILILHNPVILIAALAFVFITNIIDLILHATRPKDIESSEKLDDDSSIESGGKPETEDDSKGESYKFPDGSLY